MEIIFIFVSDIDWKLNIKLNQTKHNAEIFFVLFTDIRTSNYNLIVAGRPTFLDFVKLTHKFVKLIGSGGVLEFQNNWCFFSCFEGKKHFFAFFCWQFEKSCGKEKEWPALTVQNHKNPRVIVTLFRFYGKHIFQRCIISIDCCYGKIMLVLHE